MMILNQKTFRIFTGTAGTTLSDQTDLIETQEFQNAPPEAQQDMPRITFSPKALSCSLPHDGQQCPLDNTCGAHPHNYCYALRKRLKKIPTVTALASGITIAGLIAEGAHTYFF